MFCSSCGAQISGSGRFCSSCGTALNPDPAATIVGPNAEDGGETIAPAPATPRRTPSHPPPTQRAQKTSSSGGFLTSSDPIGGGRFTPGLILAERYRIVALLGRGGMGEVYRAEDLKLSQVVAIKLLPESLSQDESALARFHSEVRIARQVSHANVCRVFDIGDVDGIPFLTMEYVDGEDLASLIRRIGRLSPDKATEIARQICAGLAAAHERGVVHRDLKPANVMLDGAGKVRLTDFGLAAIAANIQGAEVRAGTPAYMAPEQLAGKEVTIKSDLYSLGLVLYEILTGKRAFEAATLPELLKLREAGALTNPSTLVKDLDPLLERVILRCLSTDPAQRPASALQVAAALPGGDPLAAALAAGETPSPEMVAASGTTEGMRPQLALLCLLGVIFGLAMLLMLGKRTKLISYLPFKDTPEVLAARAREMVQGFGYTDPPVDTGYGFQLNDDYLHDIEARDKSTSRWEVLRNDEPAAENFWYRQSPRLLRPFEPSSNLIWGLIDQNNPPRIITGMVYTLLTPHGKLLRFEAVPPQKDDATGPAPAPDWMPLFAAAGLNPADFRPVPPQWFPLAWGDTRAAWEGTYPGRKEIPLRIEAAAYRGKPIYFDLISPWNRATRMQPASSRPGSNFGQWFSIGLLLTLVFGGSWVAYRNLRLERGDFRGALRLALFVLLVTIFNSELLAHHVPDQYEQFIFIMAVSMGLFFAALIWMLYIAIEPYVRRRWPDTLISWTRMLAGQFRDPVVGRDLLAGLAAGVLCSVFGHFQTMVEVALRMAPARPQGFSSLTLEGLRGSLATLVYQATQSLSTALAIFFLFFLMKLIFRRNWIAAIATVLLFCLPSLGATNPSIDFLFSIPVIAVFLLILLRFGLLALAATVMAEGLADFMPITTPLNAWYAEGGVFAMMALVLLAAYGFQVARAGKPVFAPGVLDT